MAGEEWIGARDRAVLLLLYGAGLRIAEALSLTGAMLPLGETLLVTGKGNKQRVVPLLPIVRAGVADYVAHCPFPLAKNEPLFRGAKGGPLNQGMVQQAMASARIALGLPDTATPHALRHSFATHLLSAGGRFALAAGTARPRQPRLDPDLHQGRSGGAARDLSQRPSAGTLTHNRHPSEGWGLVRLCTFCPRCQLPLA